LNGSTYFYSRQESAGLEPRLISFIFDSIILLAFLALFAIVAMLQLLVRSNFGDADPPDSAYYTALGIIAGVVPFWLLFNLWLTSWRGQTVGKFIVGIRVEREDGTRPGVGRSLARILLLDPILWHPLLAIPWALLLIYGTMLTSNSIVLFATMTVLLLSIVASPVALIAALADGHRRAIHDRIAGTLVIAEP
jgi:uncharacterized RDD family membrane protein YckC